MGIEQLNRRLYSSRDFVADFLRYLTILNVTGALLLLTYRYGFALSGVESIALLRGFDIIFTMFVVIYLVRVFYAFERAAFIRETWFECILVSILSVGGLIKFVTGDRVLEILLWTFNISQSDRTYQLVISLFILLLSSFELTKASLQISNIQIKPATLFIASFLLLISLGTGLLMLPNMTTAPGSMPFLDAFFTATSAACVTGLIVVDTATYFTLKGQWIIMGLIQLGGIGIVTFATFFAGLLTQQVGLKHQSIIREHLSSETLFEAKGLLRRVVTITLLIEFLGFVLIFLTWGEEVEFASGRQKIFFSLFHSISAFCNAGFSLFSNGLYELPVRNAYVLHVIIAGIIILGGLGFNVINDLFSIRALRERLEKPWKDWTLGTKLALYVSLALILVGTVLFMALERNHLLADHALVPALITSFFQSVTTRTAGFNTVDMAALSEATVIMFLALMFIGASPGSTGGGIKTNTFFLITASALSTIRTRTAVEVAGRTIPSELLAKAFSVFAFGIAYNLLGIFLLTITERGKPLIAIMFEQVSAFATVGLSMGITSSLSPLGKLIIISSMFIGRVGTITLALAVSSRVANSQYRYPTGYVMVG
ncbi:potassium uptake protein, TrkH family [Catalinimonas alkaloidigena]|uniref:Potassium uptake protein, TrkH family n=1 Tax=Catalinimonas alkaloidigena TaxID=1075417 RepID=A0A1G9HT11_9BACT|nr:potassium transporter TrkG [Catalinimonas alkaloidigena]SDL15975.1 potassium uptake protein, TrkH family [Catalinimonas alkaloidigena]